MYSYPVSEAIAAFKELRKRRGRMLCPAGSLRVVAGVEQLKFRLSTFGIPPTDRCDVS